MKIITRWGSDVDLYTVNDPADSGFFCPAHAIGAQTARRKGGCVHPRQRRSAARATLSVRVIRFSPASGGAPGPMMPSPHTLKTLGVRETGPLFFSVGKRVGRRAAGFCKTEVPIGKMRAGGGKARREKNGSKHKDKSKRGKGAPTPALFIAPENL